MTAAAANHDTTKLFGIRYIQGPVNGGSVLYQGAMWSRNSEGNFVPSADTAGVSPPVGRGAVYVDGTGLSDGHANLSGAKCEPGVFGFAASSALVSAGIARLGKTVYVVDDLTVGLEADTTNAIPAGTLEEIRGTTFFVKLGDGAAAGGGDAGGNQNYDTITVGAPGAIDPTYRFTFLPTIDGTDAFTLADGTFPGQRVTIFVSATGTTTPIGTVTPATRAGGYANVTALGVLGDFVTFEWSADGWAIDGLFGVTVA